MVKFDIWESERKKAIIHKCGLKILKEGVYVKIWKPKGVNPYANYGFPSEEQANIYVTQEIEKYNSYKQLMAERKKDRTPTQQDLDKVKIGDIFHWSWGYDQTQCQYFQITALKGRKATLKEICAKTVGETSFMSDRRIAIKDHFLEGEKELKKMIQFFKGKPSISMGCGWCDLWDGKPKHCSWYA